MRACPECGGPVDNRGTSWNIPNPAAEQHIYRNSDTSPPPTHTLEDMTANQWHVDLAHLLHIINDMQAEHDRAVIERQLPAMRERALNMPSGPFGWLKQKVA